MPHRVHALLGGAEGQIVNAFPEISRDLVVEGLVDDGLGGGHIFAALAADAAVEPCGADADVAGVDGSQIVPPLGQLPGDDQIGSQLPGQGAVVDTAYEVLPIGIPEGPDDFNPGAADFLPLVVGWISLQPGLPSPEPGEKQDFRRLMDGGPPVPLKNLRHEVSSRGLALEGSEHGFPQRLIHRIFPVGHIVVKAKRIDFFRVISENFTVFLRRKAALEVKIADLHSL